MAFSSHVQHLQQQHGGSREREVNSINNWGAACAARHAALQPTAATQSCVYKISRCGAVKP